MSKIKKSESVLGQEKSMTEAQIENQKVDSVIGKINSELKSINAVIRAFVEVASEDAYANLMLETICDNKKDARIVLNVNEIKKYVIKHYPYKGADKKTMLKKDGGLYVPIEKDKYSADIIRKSYFAIVRPKKKEETIVEATSEQIAQYQADKINKTAASQDKRKAEKDFIQRLMEAGNQEMCWAIVQEYKAKNNPTESEKKSEK